MRRGDARRLDARDTAAFFWAAWRGSLTIGPRAERAAPGHDRELEALLEAGLRVIVGGIASDTARRRDATVRAILASAVTRTHDEPRPRGPALRRAPVASVLRERFPGLGLWTATFDGSAHPSPAAVKRGLRGTDARTASAAAIGAPGESTPWAYRVFLRRLARDPDAVEREVDHVALGGMREPSITSRGLPDDALLLAACDTGVPMIAFDAALLDDELWLREVRPGERIAGAEASIAAGTPVLADSRRPLALPFGPRDSGVAVTDATERIALAAIQVKGVSDVAIEEALWTAIEILRDSAGLADRMHSLARSAHSARTRMIVFCLGSALVAGSLVLWLGSRPGSSGSRRARRVHSSTRSSSSCSAAR